jgi:AraC-like DNA-binding protein
MPLYMDIHTVDSDDFSVEDVVKAHMEDIAVQERHGVLQIKYWVDTDNKKIFCLMKGPSKEACNAVHVESHGNTACNIIEVSDDEYNLFLHAIKTKDDLAINSSGEVDAGFRTFLLVDTIDFTGNFNHFTNEIYNLVNNHYGVNIAQTSKGILMTFVDAVNAATCAIEIMRLLNSIPGHYEYKISLVTGNPVDEAGTKLFEETKFKINTFNEIGHINTINIDINTKLILAKNPHAPKLNAAIFKVIKPNDYALILKIVTLFETEIHNPDFHLDTIYHEIGLSKAQTFRKIKSITGLAPGQFIQELRLHKSLYYLKNKSKTIAEIAYDLGFSSPTYFTRAFKKKFDILPTSFSKL